MELRASPAPLSRSLLPVLPILLACYIAAVVASAFERNVADGWSTADRGEAKRLLARWVGPKRVQDRWLVNCQPRGVVKRSGAGRGSVSRQSALFEGIGGKGGDNRAVVPGEATASRPPTGSGAASRPAVFCLQFFACPPAYPASVFRAILHPTKLPRRLRSCLRRMDVRHPDDLDEAEYSEAVQALAATAAKLAGSCRMGWRLPWGVRVRVCEAMLAGERNRLACLIPSHLRAFDIPFTRPLVKAFPSPPLP